MTDLDAVHWEGAGYDLKRDEESALAMVRDVAAGNCSIIEGVYGWLAEVAAPRATALIWLDMPWAVCRAGLLQRSQARDADASCPDALIAGPRPTGTARRAPRLPGVRRCIGPSLVPMAIDNRTGVEAWLGEVAPNAK